MAVNSDAGVRRLKGPSRPVVAQDDRAALLGALACVDHVVIFDEDTPLALVRLLQPDVLVKGGTTPGEGLVGREVVESYGGRVCLTRTVPGRSTNRLVTRIRDRVYQRDHAAETGP